MTQRLDRINELLRQEIGVLLAKDVADPGIGFVTVTRVETAADLGHARVWVSLIGQQGERSATLAALRRAMPYVRHQLNDRVRLRRIPVLHIDLDDTAERGTRVLRILHELEEGRTPDELPRTGETLPTPTPIIRPDADTDGSDGEGGLGAAAMPIPAKPARRRTGGPKDARPTGKPIRRGAGAAGPGASSGPQRSGRPAGPRPGGGDAARLRDRRPRP